MHGDTSLSSSVSFAIVRCFGVYLERFGLNAGVMGDVERLRGGFVCVSCVTTVGGGSVCVGCVTVGGAPPDRRLSKIMLAITSICCASPFLGAGAVCGLPFARLDLALPLRPRFFGISKKTKKNKNAGLSLSNCHTTVNQKLKKLSGHSMLLALLFHLHQSDCE